MTSKNPDLKIGYAFAKSKLLCGEPVHESEVKARIHIGKMDRALPCQILERLHGHYKTHTEMAFVGGEWVLSPTSSRNRAHKTPTATIPNPAHTTPRSQNPNNPPASWWAYIRG